MTTRRTVWLSLAVVLLPVATNAADRCNSKMTLAECYEQYFPDGGSEDAPSAESGEARLNEAEAAARGTATKLADAQVIGGMRNTATGTDTAGASTASTLRDFASLLSGSAVLVGGDDAETDGTLTFDLNSLLPIPGSIDKNTQIKAVVTTQPALFSPIVDGLPEDGRDAAVAALESEVSDLDDVEIMASYNFFSKENGRSFRFYRRRLDALFGDLVKDDAADLGGFVQSFSDFSGLLQEVSSRFPEIDPTTTQLRDYPDGAGEKIIDSFEAFLARDADLEQALLTRVKSSGFEHFGSLVANQPQAYLSFSRRMRSDLVGPDITSAALTYEFGLASISRFESEFGNVCRVFDQPSVKAAEGDAKACAEAYSDYVNANLASIEAGTRFAMSISYLQTDELDVVLPEYEIDLHQKPSHSLVGSLAYGRLLSIGGGDVPDARVDVVAAYEDVSDDPNRQDRLVVTATLTKRVGSMTIPLGIVYANHGRYLPETDKQLSAHIGVSFDLFSKRDGG